MIMITGGAFQGKTEFAKSRYSLKDEDIIDCGNCDIDAVQSARCVRNYELAVKRLMGLGKDPLAFTDKLKCDIILMNEIGSGIIPLEKSEREWREMTGRAGCIIASRAGTVYRVCCGIAQIIKGEEI